VNNVYDLIVVGAGPAGLVAAKTAAESGLSVALIERKESIHEVLRMCGQMIVSLSGRYMGERVVHNEKAGLLCFPHNGFNLKYDGPTKDFFSWQIYSPNEEKIVFGDYEANEAKGKAGRASAVYDKSWLLRNLVDECKCLGVNIFAGENVIDVRTDSEGVEVQTASGKHFKGVFAVAADGRQSRVARVMGMNKDRGFYGSVTSVGYEMTNLNLKEPMALHQPLVASGDPPTLGFVIPRAWDHEGDPVWLVMMTNVDPEADSEALLDNLIKKSKYSSWFKGGKVVRKCGCAGNMYSPIIKPFKGNVLFAGDAGWCQEAEMTGAAMCGAQAGSAVVEAMLEGKYNKEGVQSYLDWWQEAHISKLDHNVFLKNLYMPVLCNDKEIDYIFSKIEETLPTVLDPYEVPANMGKAMAKIIPLIQKERPELLKKLSGFNDLPPEVVLNKTIRAGFDCRFTT
jgi:flavin-dependent dehydrogenase